MSWLVKLPFRLIAYPFKLVYKTWYPDATMAEITGKEFSDLLMQKKPLLHCPNIYTRSFTKLTKEARHDRVPVLLVICKDQNSVGLFSEVLGEEMLYMLQEGKFMVFGTFRSQISDPNLLASLGNEQANLALIAVSVQRNSVLSIISRLHGNS